MEIKTSAGWIIPTNIVRCNDCLDNIECPLNKFVDKLTASQADDSPDLEPIATEARLSDRVTYRKENGPDKGKHVIYHCNGINSQSVGSGSIDLQVTSGIHYLRSPKRIK